MTVDDIRNEIHNSFDTGSERYQTMLDKIGEIYEKYEEDLSNPGIQGEMYSEINKAFEEMGRPAIDIIEDMENQDALLDAVAADFDERSIVTEDSVEQNILEETPVDTSVVYRLETEEVPSDRGSISFNPEGSRTEPDNTVKGSIVEEGMGTNPERQFTVKADAKVLVIDTREKIEALPKINGDIKNGIDFDKLSERFDAILIPGSDNEDFIVEMESIFGDEYNTEMSGSIYIFNPEVVEITETKKDPVDGGADQEAAAEKTETREPQDNTVKLDDAVDTFLDNIESHTGKDHETAHLDFEKESGDYRHIRAEFDTDVTTIKVTTADGIRKEYVAEKEPGGDSTILRFYDVYDADHERPISREEMKDILMEMGSNRQDANDVEVTVSGIEDTGNNESQTGNEASLGKEELSEIAQTTLERIHPAFEEIYGADADQKYKEFVAEYKDEMEKILNDPSLSKEEIPEKKTDLENGLLEKYFGNEPEKNDVEKAGTDNKQHVPEIEKTQPENEKKVEQTVPIDNKEILDKWEVGGSKRDVFNFRYGEEIGKEKHGEFYKELETHLSDIDKGQYTALDNNGRPILNENSDIQDYKQVTLNTIEEKNEAKLNAVDYVISMTDVKMENGKEVFEKRFDVEKQIVHLDKAEHYKELSENTSGYAKSTVTSFNRLLSNCHRHAAGDPEVKGIDLVKGGLSFLNSNIFETVIIEVLNAVLTAIEEHNDVDIKEDIPDKVEVNDTPNTQENTYEKVDKDGVYENGYYGGSVSKDEDADMKRNEINIRGDKNEGYAKPFGIDMSDSGNIKEANVAGTLYSDKDIRVSATRNEPGKIEINIKGNYITVGDSLRYIPPMRGYAIEGNMYLVNCTGRVESSMINDPDAKTIFSVGDKAIYDTAKSEKWAVNITADRLESMLSRNPDYGAEYSKLSKEEKDEIKQSILDQAVAIEKEDFNNKYETRLDAEKTQIETKINEVSQKLDELNEKKTELEEKLNDTDISGERRERIQEVVDKADNEIEKNHEYKDRLEEYKERLDVCQEKIDSGVDTDEKFDAFTDAEANATGRIDHDLNNTELEKEIEDISNESDDSTNDVDVTEDEPDSIDIQEADEEIPEDEGNNDVSAEETDNDHDKDDRAAAEDNAEKEQAIDDKEDEQHNTEAEEHDPDKPQEVESDNDKRDNDQDHKEDKAEKPEGEKNDQSDNEKTDDTEQEENKTDFITSESAGTAVDAGSLEAESDVAADDNAEHVETEETNPEKEPVSSEVSADDAATENTESKADNEDNPEQRATDESNFDTERSEGIDADEEGIKVQDSPTSGDDDNLDDVVLGGSDGSREKSADNSNAPGSKAEQALESEGVTSESNREKFDIHTDQDEKAKDASSEEKENKDNEMPDMPDTGMTDDLNMANQAVNLDANNEAAINEAIEQETMASNDSIQHVEVTPAEAEGMAAADKDNIEKVNEEAGRIESIAEISGPGDEDETPYSDISNEHPEEMMQSSPEIESPSSGGFAEAVHNLIEMGALSPDMLVVELLKMDLPEAADIMDTFRNPTQELFNYIVDCVTDHIEENIANGDIEIGKWDDEIRETVGQIKNDLYAASGTGLEDMGINPESLADAANDQMFEGYKDELVNMFDNDHAFLEDGSVCDAATGEIQEHFEQSAADQLINYVDMESKVQIEQELHDLEIDNPDIEVEQPDDIDIKSEQIEAAEDMVPDISVEIDGIEEVAEEIVEIIL